MILEPPRTLSELADYAGGEIQRRLASLGSPDLMEPLRVTGDGGRLIRALSPVESIEPGSLVFATSRDYLERIESSEAAAVIVSPELKPRSLPYIAFPLPRLAFSVMLELSAGPPTVTAGAPERVVFKDRPSSDISPDVLIGDGCYVGARVRIGRGSRIYPQVFIDDDVVIGENCLVYPRVTLLRRTTIGNEVIIHAGAVIGDDGFGYNQVPDPGRGRLHHLKNVHVGGVVIEDRAEVGSQVCIDRGLVGDTVVGAGTKIDNLCQIAHNVHIGRECIIVAQAAIGGNAAIGDQAFILGQVGVKNGVTVGAGALVTANTMVLEDLPAGRNRWAGRPAQPADAEWKQLALARKELPRLREFLRLFRKAKSFEELQARFAAEVGSRKREEKK